MSQTIKRPANYQLGEARITVLGQNKTTPAIAIYSAQFTPAEGVSFPIGTLRSSERDKTWHYQHNGGRAAPTFQNEMTNEATLTLSYIDDAFYWGSRVCANVDKSIITSMLRGESFKVGSDIIKIVGTNGTAMTGGISSSNSTLNDYQYLFYDMGKESIPGTDDGTGRPIRIANDDIAAYNPYGLTVMIEIFTTLDTGTKQGYRWVYVADKKTTGTENASENTRSIDFDLYSDTLSIDSFYIDGLTDAYSTATTIEVLSTTPTTIYGLNVKYLTQATNVGTVTIPETVLGTLCAAIDSDDGKLSVLKCSGSATWTALTNTATITYGVGCVIRANYTGTSASAAAGGVGFAAVKLSNVSASATACLSTTGSYIYPVNDLSLTATAGTNVTSGFAAYVG
jgi:hypothetical protein